MSAHEDWFVHPKRFPKNADGPFYTTGGQDKDGVWCGDCLSCELPEDEAPDLLAPLREGNTDTYFVRQPEAPDEVERACWALKVCCTDALRYGGKDPEIIKALPPFLCDYRVSFFGRVVRNRRWWWAFGGDRDRAWSPVPPNTGLERPWPLACGPQGRVGWNRARARPVVPPATPLNPRIVGRTMMDADKAAKAYPTLEKRIARLLVEHDPSGLFAMGAPHDEHDEDVRAISRPSNERLRWATCARFSSRGSVVGSWEPGRTSTICVTRWPRRSGRPGVNSNVRPANNCVNLTVRPTTRIAGIVRQAPLRPAGCADRWADIER